VLAKGCALAVVPEGEVGEGDFDGPVVAEWGVEVGAGDGAHEVDERSSGGGVAVEVVAGGGHRWGLLVWMRV